MARTRDDQAQRLLLSEAVFATLAESGPSGLTLRAVAERAGCTTGLVLHAFPDKRALLLHARDVLHERTRRRADELERTAADAASAVRAIVVGALPTDEETLADARVWVGFLAAALSDSVLAERHAENSRAFSQRLTRLLDSVEPLSPSTSSERARALVAAVEGISTLAAGDPHHWPAETQRAALDVVLSATVGDRPDEALTD